MCFATESEMCSRRAFISTFVSMLSCKVQAAHCPLITKVCHYLVNISFTEFAAASAANFLRNVIERPQMGNVTIVCCICLKCGYFIILFLTS